MNKKQKLIITIISIITILLMGGLTYAFFSANPVEGNSNTNTIVTLTADYGDIIVTYDSNDGSISASNIDLIESEKGENQSYLLKFNVESTANISRDITINWKDVTNTFCEYQLNGNCTNNEADTYVGDEIGYNLYSCSVEDYNNATTSNVSTNCTSIGNNILPETGDTSKLTTNEYVTLLPTNFSYYVLLITLQNKETEQNYNQGRSYSGGIYIDFKREYVALDGYLYDEDGNPIGNTDLELHSNPVYATTDVNGYFNFGEVETGTHTITATNSSDTVILSDNITVLKSTENSVNNKIIKTSSEITIDLTRKNDNTINEIVEYDLKSLSDKILETNTPVADNTSSTYVSSGTGINFGAISSPTNGQGLYINSKSNIASDPTQGTIKYFRGGTYCAYTNYAADSSGTNCMAVGGSWTGSGSYHCSLHDSKSSCEGLGFTYYELKNNVMFAGFAWKIIRINADGSIRMIYNGTSPLSRGANAQISASKFNTLANDNAYVGYMYGAIQQPSNGYTATHTNTNNSLIRTTNDTWYSNNLSSHTSKIANGGFCGDRKLYSGYGAWTYDAIYFPYNRLYTNKTPTFSCPLTNDLFTLTTGSTGNKKLTYSTGLITADELVYAGGVFGTSNLANYLQSGGYYWTMSAAYLDNNDAVNEFYTHYSGAINYASVSISYGIRPVINLNSDVMVRYGAGTLNSPYVIYE